MAWKHGCMSIGQTTEVIARKAAAMFVSLWLRGVSASFADKLMDGYITFLERQEGEFLTFLAEIDCYSNGRPFLRLTREGLMRPGHTTANGRSSRPWTRNWTKKSSSLSPRGSGWPRDGTPMCGSRCPDCGWHDEGHVHADPDTWLETP